MHGKHHLYRYSSTLLIITSDERGVPSRWRQLKCQSIKSQRRLNRLLGQPESKEVKIISEQLSLLQTGTEALLDRTVDRVMVSYPPLRGLWEDDVVDAIRHTGLDHIPFSEDTNTVSSARAAIAANGLGMCDHYTDPLACWDETYHMKWRVVLAIEYTKDTLIVTLTDMKGIHDVTDNFSEVCIECGAESEIKHLDPSFYWPHLRNKILALPTAHRVPVTNVVLYGEAAPDTEFQENLIKALGNVQDERGEPISIGNPNDSQKVLSRRTKNLGLLDSGIHVQIVDPVVAPARGAAELAKRRLDAPTDDRGKKLPI